MSGKSNLKTKDRRKQRKKTNDKSKERARKDVEKVLGSNIIFGLDNGATGTISCIVPYSKDDIEIFFDKTFANIEDDYQKDSQKIARIDWEKLKEWFLSILKKSKQKYIKKYSFEKTNIKVSVIMERPMINAERFKQSKNAARAFEATLVVLEMIGLKDNYIIIDSKKWQHYFFGKYTLDLNLKEESQKKGIEYLNMIDEKKYSKMCDLIRKHGDADSLLIARFALEKLV